MTAEDDTAAALKRLIDDGSDLSRPMSIDFMVAVPSETAGLHVASEATTRGFEASVEQDEESCEWTCYCTKTIVADYASVVAIEQELDDIARAVGGHIDGFGTFGNAPEAV